MVTKLKINSNKLNLFVDIGIALAFVVEMEEHFTGLRNHELIGLAFGAALIVHLVLHWRWVLTVTKQFFHKVFHESRFNYVLNLGILIDMIVITVTGIVISRTLGLSFGLDRQVMQSWQRIHIIASELSLLLVALHVALHWKWIVAHSKKYLFAIRLPWRKLPSANTATASSTSLPIARAK